ncbi:hypothetical protein QA811_38380 [Streptomyces sp. B21-102]|uniref:hypothetical protein n=1 Tax=Streptomyces sp. B21-102 TaxID=3039416 RepID=UPI001A8D64AD
MPNATDTRGSGRWNCAPCPAGQVERRGASQARLTLRRGYLLIAFGRLPTAAVIAGVTRAVTAEIGVTIAP